MAVPSAIDKRLKHVFRVLIYLFDRYTSLHDVPADMRSRVSVYAFMRWVATDAPSSYEISAGLDDVPLDVIEDARGILQGPDAVGRIAGLWPYVIFGDQETRNKLKAICIATLLQYADGTVAPLMVYAHQDVTSGELDDAAVMSIMTTYPPQLANTLTLSGLDDIYERYVRASKGLFDAEVFQALEAAINASSSDPVMKKRMGELVSLVMSLLPPTLPAYVREHYGKDKPNPGRRVDPNAEEPSGGWSLPG